MNFNWKKFVMVLALPALLIYAAVQVFPPILTPYLGVVGAQYSGAVASILTIIGVLYIYKKFVRKQKD